MNTGLRRDVDESDHDSQAARAVFLGVLLAGAVLIAITNHIHPLGTLVGTASLSALPLVAATAATMRLHHH